MKKELTQPTPSLTPDQVAAKLVQLHAMEEMNVFNTQGAAQLIAELGLPIPDCLTPDQLTLIVMQALNMYPDALSRVFRLGS